MALSLSDREQALVVSVQAVQDQMERELIDLCDLNSGSTHLEGIKSVQQRLVKFAAPLGAEVEFVPLPDREDVDASGSVRRSQVAPLLKLTKHREANRKILFSGHCDTVFPKTHHFQSCRRNGELICGPGTADMKGGLLVMLHALMAFEKSDQAGSLGWEVLINPDEEVGSPSSAAELAAAARRADLGMVFEPALEDGTMAGARKGSGNFTLIVRGRSAHAGREFQAGRNAVAALARVMSRLDQLNGQRDELTVNVAGLSGGSPSNVVPDFALCRFNIRVLSPDDQCWAEASLQSLLEEVGAQEQDGISLELHGGFGRQAKLMTPELKSFFESLRSCGDSLEQPVSWRATGGCCDGNNLAAAGLVCIDTLGVRGANLHSAQEYMIASSLSERAALSALLLYRLASGQIPFP